MGKVVLDMSMSLDGFIAGPNDDLERVHNWMFPASRDVAERDAEVVDEMFRTTGAVVMGRRTFDVGVKENGWSGWVDDPPFQVPIFVPTHHVPDKAAKGGSMFTFVTDGVERAVEQAKAVAGDKNVNVNGASIAQQCLRADLLDEMHLHLVPVLLGDGIQLFERTGTEHIELERTGLIEVSGVTHLRFRIVK
jgi:dihydrofolate reductase